MLVPERCSVHVAVAEECLPTFTHTHAHLTLEAGKAKEIWYMNLLKCFFCVKKINSEHWSMISKFRVRMEKDESYHLDTDLHPPTHIGKHVFHNYTSVRRTAIQVSVPQCVCAKTLAYGTHHSELQDLRSSGVQLTSQSKLYI